MMAVKPCYQNGAISDGEHSYKVHTRATSSSSSVTLRRLDEEMEIEQSHHQDKNEKKTSSFQRTESINMSNSDLRHSNRSFKNNNPLEYWSFPEEIFDHDENNLTLDEDYYENSQEYMQLEESITWLNHHVPQCVFATLAENVQESSITKIALRREDSIGEGPRVRAGSFSDWYWGDKKFARKDSTATDGIKLPHYERHHCALLFIDISGFTKLSTLLDVESLSQAINSYFQVIVDEISNHGGDILKFAGDAIFAEWRVDEDVRFDTMMQLDICVMKASVCGAMIVKKCSDYPVYQQKADSNVGTKVSTLNVHCGIGAGEIASLHVGDDWKREFLIFGNPIDQVAEAEHVARLGELAASPEALLHLGKTCTYPTSYAQKFHSAYVARTPCVIACSKEIYFVPNELSRRRSSMATRGSLDQELFDQYCGSMNIARLRHLKHLLSFYVHPVVKNVEYMEKGALDFVGQTFVNRNLGIEVNDTEEKGLQMRHRAEAEIRTVYTMFIMPLIQACIDDDDVANHAFCDLLNNVLLVVNRELERYNGHLRQYIVDDKGVVIIATFGLRGALFPDMVSQFALPATIAIHNALLTELELENQVGATVGRAYCGVVGGLRRHEFAVLGPSVNLAARLMANPMNPGILVADSVRKMASKKYEFQSLPPVKAKGYKDLVPIFKPTKVYEKRWLESNNPCCRDKPIELIFQKATGLILSRAGVEVILVTGKTGVGKSSVVSSALKKVTKFCNKEYSTSFKVNINSTTCNHSERFIPLSAFRPIILEMLNYSQWDEYFGTAYEAEQGDEISDSLNGGFFSKEASDLDNSFMYFDLSRLHYMCKQLGVKKEEADFIGKNFLGFDSEIFPGAEVVQIENVLLTLSNMFMAYEKVSDFLIMFIDDAHNMDDLSWRFFEILQHRLNNALFVFSTLPIDFNEARPRTWVKHLRRSNCFEVEVQPLSRNELLIMIAEDLNVETEYVDNQLVDDIFHQSRGMANFASSFLEEIKNEGMIEFDNFAYGWKKSIDRIAVLNSFRSVEEIILHRMDSLGVEVRTILTLCAVLGEKFTFDELFLTVQIRSRQNFNDDLLDVVRNCINAAYVEGILVNVVHGLEREEESDPDDEDLLSRGDEIRFSHELWRSAILNTILHSHKQDIHKSIAQAIENASIDSILSHPQENDLEFSLNLYGHWRDAGVFEKAADLALKLGLLFKSLGINHQSFKLYEESLSMWTGADASQISFDVLQTIKPSELEFILRLKIEMANIMQADGDYEGCNQCFVEAFEMFENALASKDISDHTITFPIFTAIVSGPTWDTNEDDILRTKNILGLYVREARLSGEIIHVCRALALQCLTLFRLGMLKNALECHWELEDTYDVKYHSSDMVAYYEQDYVLHSFGLCTQINFMLENEFQLDYSIEFLISHVLPFADRNNVMDTFTTLYPVIWVLKERGMAMRAMIEYDRFLITTLVSAEKAKNVFVEVFTPLAVLLKLSAEKNFLFETEIQGFTSFEELEYWVLRPTVGVFSTEIEKYTLYLGRGASIIVAEICLILLQRRKIRRRNELLKKGFMLAKQSIIETTSRPEFLYAFRQTQQILDGLSVFSSTKKTFSTTSFDTLTTFKKPSKDRRKRRHSLT